MSATERVLLASLLEYPEACHQSLALGLLPEDFTEESNRAIFSAIAKLVDGGNLVSYESLMAALQQSENGKFDLRAAALADLLDPLHTPRTDVTWHVEQLKNAKRRQTIKAVCQSAALQADDGSISTDECLGNLNNSLLRLEAATYKGRSSRLREVVAHGLRNLEERSKCDGLIGLDTGIARLNEITTGIRAGELWIVGALPGRGKTALAVQIAMANAKVGTPATLFSLEMSKDELADRFLANESRVPTSRIRDPRYLSAEDWRALVGCANAMDSWALYIDDTSSLTIQALVSRARLHIKQHGTKLIIVDYLRLVDSPGRELRERMSHTADALRQLAKKEQVGIVALSQLSRPRDGDINARPTMVSLKESGDLEASAHVVLLIYTPMQNDVPTGEDEIIVAKNRHGSMGSIDVHFDRNWLKFVSRDKVR